MKPRFTMRQALDDPALLGATLQGPSWAAWRVLLIAAMGERLTPAERRIFSRLTGRAREPLKRVEEAWLVIGRRGGKSRALAALAAYLSGLCDHRDVLAPGERGIVLCIAPDQKQAGIILDYAEAAFRAAPIMAQLIGSRTADALELTSGIALEVRAASFRRLRGPSFVAVLADEAAFWHDSEASTNPDTEILNAVRPGLATTGGPLLCASSPYARRGALWDAHRKHFGPDGDKLIMVAQAPTRSLNPTLPQRVVDRAMERDPAAAAAEYLAQFRSDIESYISREAVEATVSRGVRERAPLPGVQYFGFVDPSGGSVDSMTLAIAHREADRAIIDCLREVRPPFSPSGVVAEFATLLKSYRVRQVRGDRYAGEWPREQFRQRGVEYFPADKTKSDLYVDLLAPLNSARVDLLDNDRLVTQLAGLERRTARSGKDSIDHTPGARDDVANAVAGAVHLALARPQPRVGLAAPKLVEPSSHIRWIGGEVPQWSGR
ncbi:MAG TPA: hypothetical protein VJ890_21645 [Vineibacter sp.]|nr:hypothetical protein [Vineibacter sp.]